MEWILANKEWLFSGIGVTVSLWFANLYRVKGKQDAPTSNNVNNNSNIINVNVGSKQEDPSKTSTITNKSDVQILFIDDEKFDIVSILKDGGWSNTKTIKDVKNLDCMDVKNANVIFVDINGVGCNLFPKDQGLGLAEAIKSRNPEKFIIIYSAQEQRLHRAFSMVNAVLPKNAEPYEFINILDNYLRNKI